MDEIEELAKNLELGLHRPYGAVSVLCLYWEHSEGFQKEARELMSLFSEDFHFKTQEYAIPPILSHISLLLRICAFIKDENPQGSRTLLIIHYGGHGDPNTNPADDSERRKLVFAQRSSGGPTVDWHEIEKLFLRVEAHVLFILDCCHSGQAGRTITEYPNHIEVIAACPMNAQTPQPGDPGSFTPILISQIRRLLFEFNCVAMGTLYEYLRIEMREETPVYSPMGLGRRKDQRTARMGIILQPLEDRKAKRIPNLKNTASELNLLIRYEKFFDKELVRKSLDWLLSSTPEEVLSIEPSYLLRRTGEHDALMSFALRRHEGGRLIDKIDVSAKDKVKICWQHLYDFVRSERGWLQKSDSETEGDPERISLTDAEETLERVDRLVRWISEGSRWSLLPMLGEEHSLPADGIRLIQVQIPQLRLLAQAPESCRVNLQIEPERLDPEDDDANHLHHHQTFRIRKLLGQNDTTPESGHEVLVEYHKFEDDESVSWIQPQVLCNIMNIATDPAFCSLRCLHWFEGCSNYPRTCGLIFDIPPNLKAAPVSLKSIITNEIESADIERPSLAQRLNIARKIGEAVDLWHQSGWAHRNIGSHTIAFLRDHETGNVDFSQPFLTDFSFCQPCRPSSWNRGYPKPHSRPHPILELLDLDVRMDDLLAFGLLLFEIGLWKTTDAIFQNENCSLSEFKDDVKKQGKILGFAMGTRYQKAAELCLDQYEFSMDKDDGENKYWIAQKAFKLVTEILPSNPALDE